MTWLQGKCEGGDGPDLTRYPRLTHAPDQWGEGVRVASNGAAVAEIALTCEEQLSDLAIAAGHYQITLAELFDALLYAHDQAHP
jgi:hypothetical protein